MKKDEKKEFEKTLFPCKWCGRDAHIVKGTTDGGWVVHHITCSAHPRVCGNRTAGQRLSLKDARDEWNFTRSAFTQEIDAMHESAMRHLAATRG